jgi:hypothetical protein
VALRRGYILLLCRRRIGLYLVLSSILVLGASFLQGLPSIFIYGLEASSITISALLGGLNPLFGYLAVRSADKFAPVSGAPQPARSASSPKPETAKTFRESDNLGTRQETSRRPLRTGSWSGRA